MRPVGKIQRWVPAGALIASLAAPPLSAAQREQAEAPTAEQSQQPATTREPAEEAGAGMPKPAGAQATTQPTSRQPDPVQQSGTAAPSLQQDPGRPPVNDFGPDEDVRSVVQAQGGFLGTSWLMDFVILLVVGLLSAVASAVLATRRYRNEALSHMNERLKRMEQTLNGLSLNNRAPVEQERYPAVPTRRGSPSDGSGLAARSLREMTPAAVPPPPAPNPAISEQAGRMNKALEEYLQLVAGKGAKPTQLTDLLHRFPDRRALRLDGHQISASPFSSDDPSQLVVAAGDGQRFVVLPTHNYLASFQVAFAAPVQNPEILRRLFQFHADGSKQLRVDVPAEISIDEAGRVEIMRTGRLSGFES